MNIVKFVSRVQRVFDPGQRPLTHQWRHHRNVNINIATRLPLKICTAHFVCPFVACDVRLEARPS